MLLCMKKDLNVSSSCFYWGGDRGINSKQVDNEIQLPCSSFHRIVMCPVKSILTVQSLMLHVSKKKILKINIPHSALTLMTLIYINKFAYRMESYPRVVSLQTNLQMTFHSTWTGHALRGKEPPRFFCCLH